MQKSPKLGGSDVVREALDHVSSLYERGEPFTSPNKAREYFCLRPREIEHDVFCVAFLDNRHRLIACEDLFRGTVDGTSVHPREVAKDALKHNAAALVFGHNHRSGVPEPSAADQALTRRLQEALAMLDVRVLDHIVVGGSEYVSFTERGLL